MRLLIGYDGSAGAKDAIDDLASTGLPADVEAVVLTVANVWPPALSAADLSAMTPESSHLLRGVHEMARQTKREAEACSADGERIVAAKFPTWKVRAETTVGAPHWGVVEFAERFKPDLIVVGERGLSRAAQAVERVLMGSGSVAQSVVRHASCSVRICRWSRERAARKSAIRIVIGIDGSPQSALAVKAVLARQWPRGAEAKLVSVVDRWMMTAAPMLLTTPVPHPSHDVQATLAGLLEHQQRMLLDAKIAATSIVTEGSPKQEILAEAEKWDADCIFVGAQGLGRFGRVLLGSVSCAVAERARCSVEIVRGTGPH